MILSYGKMNSLYSIWGKQLVHKLCTFPNFKFGCQCFQNFNQVFENFLHKWIFEFMRKLTCIKLSKFSRFYYWNRNYWYPYENKEILLSRPMKRYLSVYTYDINLKHIIHYSLTILLTNHSILGDNDGIFWHQSNTSIEDIFLR